MGNGKKRKIDILVLSDIHLGTYGCHAEELVRYLKSIKPKKVILNGDIIDIWQFKKRYFPKAHLMVIKQIMNWVSKGIEVVYITGNHDETLRKFVGFELGSFSIQNKHFMDIKGEEAWFFHGDVFDVTMQHSRWVAKLGAIGYDSLIIINRFVNVLSEAMGKGKVSLSKKIKDSVKGAVKFINNFEQTAVDIAAVKGCKFVLCGHIHKPEMKTFITKNGEVNYLNSGDWIENLTALEYKSNNWSIYKYFEDPVARTMELKEEQDSEKSTKELFGKMVEEFALIK